MNTHLAYLYLLSPLHTGGASQEGNLVGVARESHTDIPYLPSSTIRGRLRAATPDNRRSALWGHTIDDVMQGAIANLTQGTIWVGNGEILWFPVPSLSHGVVWITSCFLLRRWLRLSGQSLLLPEVGSFSAGNNQKLYLRDAIFSTSELRAWQDWRQYLPTGSPETRTISSALILSDADCQILIKTSLWRQVRVNLDEDKIVKGGFRYEEAIPPETLMYFPWDTTTTTKGNGANPRETAIATEFQNLLRGCDTWQFGGQESLGRGFVELWTDQPTSGQETSTPAASTPKTSAQ